MKKNDNDPYLKSILLPFEKEVEPKNKRIIDITTLGFLEIIGYLLIISGMFKFFDSIKDDGLLMIIALFLLFLGLFFLYMTRKKDAQLIKTKGRIIYTGNFYKLNNSTILTEMGFTKINKDNLPLYSISTRDIKEIKVEKRIQIGRCFIGFFFGVFGLGLLLERLIDPISIYLILERKVSLVNLFDTFIIFVKIFSGICLGIIWGRPNGISLRSQTGREDIFIPVNHLILKRGFKERIFGKTHENLNSIIQWLKKNHLEETKIIKENSDESSNNKDLSGKKQKYSVKKIAIAFIITLCLFIIISSYLQSFERNPNWSEDIKVSKNYDVKVHSPRIILDKKNNIFGVWVEENDKNISIHFTKITSDGKFVIPDRKLMDSSWIIVDSMNKNPQPHANWGPDIAVDSENNLHIIWPNPIFGLNYSKLNNDGEFIVDSVEIYPELSYIFPWKSCSIEIDSKDNVHIIARERSRMFYFKLDRNGTLLIKKPLTTGLVIIGGLTTTIDKNNNIHITWMERGFGADYHIFPPFSIHYMKINNKGEKLLEKDIQGENSNKNIFANFAEIALDLNDHAHIIWWTGKYEDLWLTSSLMRYELDENGSLISIKKLPIHPSILTMPVINFDEKNRAHIIWRADTEDNWELYHSILYPNNNYINTERISIDPYMSMSPTMIIDQNDELHLFWIDYRNDVNNGNIYYKTTKELQMQYSEDKDILEKSYTYLHLKNKSERFSLLLISIIGLIAIFILSLRLKEGEKQLFDKTNPFNSFIMKYYLVPSFLLFWLLPALLLLRWNNSLFASLAYFFGSLSIVYTIWILLGFNMLLNKSLRLKMKLIYAYGFICSIISSLIFKFYKLEVVEFVIFKNYGLTMSDPFFVFLDMNPILGYLLIFILFGLLTLSAFVHLILSYDAPLLILRKLKKSKKELRKSIFFFMVSLCIIVTTLLVISQFYKWVNFATFIIIFATSTPVTWFLFINITEIKQKRTIRIIHLPKLSRNLIYEKLKKFINYFKHKVTINKFIFGIYLIIIPLLIMFSLPPIDLLFSLIYVLMWIIAIFMYYNKYLFNLTYDYEKKTKEEIKVEEKEIEVDVKNTSKPRKSYYKIIDGQKYDRELLKTAHELTKGKGDGRISLKDAEKLWKDAQDNNKVTIIEIKTLEYILDNLNCTNSARNYLERIIIKK